MNAINSSTDVKEAVNREAMYSTRHAIHPELAEHFVRGRDAGRAVRYLQCAGEQALQRSAYQEAFHHLTRGLALLDELADMSVRV